MKRFLVIILLSFVSVLSSTAQNTSIQQMIESISADSLQKNVQELESYPSRFLFSDYGRDVAFYLKERMQGYGFEVVIDSFYLEDFYYLRSVPMNSGWLYNVLCLKRGTTAVDTSLFFGAHYDCISTNEEGFTDFEHYAPGADDNASGVATLLELARVWNEYDISSRYNLRIEFYAGEELGLLGSNDRMHKLASPWTMEVLGMINLDMVGYNETDTISINYYTNSDEYTSKAVENTRLYTDLTPKLTDEYINASDSWNFYIWGLKTVFLTENDFSPYYHTLQDSSKYLDFDYMKKICAVAFSLACDFAKAEGNSVALAEIERNESDIIDFCQTDRYLRFQTFENYDKSQLIIVDNMGRLRINTPLSTFVVGENAYQVDISHLGDGFYNLLITSSQKRINKKFILVR